MEVPTLTVNELCGSGYTKRGMNASLCHWKVWAFSLAFRREVNGEVKVLSLLMNC